LKKLLVDATLDYAALKGLLGKMGIPAVKRSSPDGVRGERASGVSHLRCCRGTIQSQAIAAAMPSYASA